MSEPFPQLLVSVRNLEEAGTAFEGGADVIDVKEPGNGPLGAADKTVQMSIAQRYHSRRPVSAAQGELLETDFPNWDLSDLSYLKWGLSGCQDRNWSVALRSRQRALAERGSGSPTLVLVGYADSEEARSPPIADLLSLAGRERHAIVLIDTFKKGLSHKGERLSLLRYLSPHRLAAIVEQCRGHGAQIALAGSLTEKEIRLLLSGGAKPDWFAVRGAACAQGNRQGALCLERIRALKALLQGENGEASRPGGASDPHKLSLSGRSSK